MLSIRNCMQKQCLLPRQLQLLKPLVGLCRYNSNKDSVRRFSSVEGRKYERKTPHEHVLLRPGMYIGQMTSSNHDVWVYDDNSNKMMKSSVDYSAALLKLFDEIVVNAADNKTRDKKMSYIDISVDTNIADNKIIITVANDGRSIPIELNKEEKMYIPELIFGNLLTGSNFDDSVGNVTGGRHGYGAKLTNIFSKSFQIEVYDSKRKLHYIQKWDNNMQTTHPPIITATATAAATPACIIPSSASASASAIAVTLKDHSSDFINIIFEPDLMRFESDGVKVSITELEKMFKRRAVDIAACVSPVKVSYNKKLLPVASFIDYVNLFTVNADKVRDMSVAATSASADVDSNSNDDITLVSPDVAVATDTNNDNIFYAKLNDRWEIAVKRSTTGAFEHVSFVNSVWTPRGGSHVNQIASQITKVIEEQLKKKNISMSPSIIRSKLMIFIKATIPNPTFDSQSKDALTSPASAFGSKCELSKVFIKNIITKSGIMEELVHHATMREQSKLLKVATSVKYGNHNRAVEVPKLDDAHYAGHATKALDCTLIITEGDSAKALAVAGLEVVGREYYGVLPLRGKILNVRMATAMQLSKNEEIINLIKSLGLDFTKSYGDGLHGQGLRYGRVMMMCDQDKDGTHIKGLLINFFHHLWPNLLYKEGFLRQFVTPLVKVTLGSKAGSIKAFYSMPEYDAWRRSLTTASSKKAATAAGIVKYYKGLGTNTADEGKEYFKELEKHRKTFYSSSNITSTDLIDLAFSKFRASDRRYWLSNSYNSESYIDPKDTSISYEDFINKEFIQFSFADNQRSIPSVVDGLKPAQRKILYGCFKRNLENDIKVVQLAGYIAEQTSYHHGEVSLHAAIVNMAQDFVGSNNLPLLVPSGQFGTRAQGGKDFASPRYIFTRLSSLARAIYPVADDAILEYLKEDGQSVEPKYFIPIIPMLLVNGAEGIGTGWSTSIPSYNPIDIIKCVIAMLDSCSSSSSSSSSNVSKKLKPWYYNFAGSIIKSTDSSSIDSTTVNYITTGVAKVINHNTIEIVELPIGKWTADYKEFLCRLIETGVVKSFNESHKTNNVCFTVHLTKEAAATMINGTTATAAVNEVFKLDSIISLNNMHAFSREGKILKYWSPEEVLHEHYAVRLHAYELRKRALIKKLAIDEAIARSKSMFVDDILLGNINLLSAKGGGESIKQDTLVKELRSRKYLTIHDIHGTQIMDSTEAERGVAGVVVGNDYDYLISMPISSLTRERSVELKKQADSCYSKLDEIKTSSPEMLWKNDLTHLLNVLKKVKY